MADTLLEKEYAKSGLLKLSREFCERCGHAPLAYVHSFGCQQNVSDGEKLKGQLSGIGYDFTDDIAKAQLILLNTCAVRENAEDKVYAVIGDLKKFKAAHPDTILGLCGCMAQEKKTSERVQKAYPQVDLIFGTFAYPRLYSMLAKVLTDRFSKSAANADGAALYPASVDLSEILASPFALSALHFPFP